VNIHTALRMINPAPAGGWTYPTGTYAHWWGDLLASGDWADRTGAEHHATLVGSPTLSATDGMTCTVGKYATLADTPTFATGGTMCAWVYQTQFASTRVALGGWASANEYLLAVLSSGVVQAGYGGTAAYSTGSLSLNTWHHIAMVWTGTHVIAYLDGVAGTPVAKSGSTSSTQTFYIGTYQTTTLPFVGNITDAMVIQAAQDADGIEYIIDNSPGSKAA